MWGSHGPHAGIAIETRSRKPAGAGSGPHPGTKLQPCEELGRWLGGDEAQLHQNPWQQVPVLSCRCPGTSRNPGQLPLPPVLKGSTLSSAPRAPSPEDKPRQQLQALTQSQTGPFACFGSGVQRRWSLLSPLKCRPLRAPGPPLQPLERAQHPREDSREAQEAGEHQQQASAPARAAAVDGQGECAAQGRQKCHLNICGHLAGAPVPVA